MPSQRKRLEEAERRCTLGCGHFSARLEPAQHLKNFHVEQVPRVERHGLFEETPLDTLASRGAEQEFNDCRPAAAARALSLRWRRSGTCRIWIIFDMCTTCTYVDDMSKALERHLVRITHDVEEGAIHVDQDGVVRARSGYLRDGQGDAPTARLTRQRIAPPANMVSMLTSRPFDLQYVPRLGFAQLTGDPKLDVSSLASPSYSSRAVALGSHTRTTVSACPSESLEMRTRVSDGTASVSSAVVQWNAARRASSFAPLILPRGALQSSTAPTVTREVRWSSAEPSSPGRRDGATAPFRGTSPAAADRSPPFVHAAASTTATSVTRVTLCVFIWRGCQVHVTTFRPDAPPVLSSPGSQSE